MSKLKQLQNNFTTPEQSKRLLELGVPAWTADCYYDKYRILPELLFDGDTFQDLLDANEPEDPNEYLPCWSVGRLQQIYAICFTGEPFTMWYDDNFFLPENVIGGIEEHKKELDFSKLEE